MIEKIIVITSRMVAAISALFLLYPMSVAAQGQNEEYTLQMLYSPDGSMIATSGLEFLKIWDAQTKDLLLDLPVDEYITDIAWSPDGTQLASMEGIAKLDIWHISGSDYDKTQVALGGLGGIDFYRTVNWSPDGNYIAVGDSIGGIIDILDATDYSVVTSIAGGAYKLAWDPDPKIERIAVTDIEASGVGLVSLNPSPISSIGRNIGAKAFQWNSDGTEIAIGYVDGFVLVWDITTLQTVWQMSTDDVFVETLSWSRDNKYIVTVSGNATLRIWDSSTGSLIQTSEKLRAMAAAYSPTEDKIAYSFLSDTINIIDSNQNLLPFPTFTPSLTSTPKPM